MNITNSMLESVEQGKQLCITIINVYEVLKGLRCRNNSRLFFSVPMSSKIVIKNIRYAGKRRKIMKGKHAI